MEVDNEVRLLLRFKKNIAQNTDIVLQKFKNEAEAKDANYSIKISGTHIWLNIKGEQKKYYSPHLHVELVRQNETETQIRGLFGPDPTLWTFFMFLHFIIAGVFMIFCVILFSDYILKHNLNTDFIILGLMTFCWFLLYFIARQIRHNGNDQMHDLEKLFQKIINS